MNHLLKSISYIFHPLFMPLMCVVFYFSKSPRYITFDIILVKTIMLFILTVLLPIIIYFLLKPSGVVKSIHLESTKERIAPLLINGIILLIILSRLFTITDFIELYYFFVGFLISTFVCLILTIAKFKASIHMIGICSVFMYFIALSFHFSVNMNSALALMAIITGAIATSRLLLKAHTNNELIIGGVIGIIPQLLVLPFWL